MYSCAPTMLLKSVAVMGTQKVSPWQTLRSPISMVTPAPLSSFTVTDPFTVLTRIRSSLEFLNSILGGRLGLGLAKKFTGEVCPVLPMIVKHTSKRTEPLGRSSPLNGLIQDTWRVFALKKPKLPLGNGRLQSSCKVLLQFCKLSKVRIDGSQPMPNSMRDTSWKLSTVTGTQTVWPMPPCTSPMVAVMPPKDPVTVILAGVPVIPISLNAALITSQV